MGAVSPLPSLSRWFLPTGHAVGKKGYSWALTLLRTQAIQVLVPFVTTCITSIVSAVLVNM